MGVSGICNEETQEAINTEKEEFKFLLEIRRGDEGEKAVRRSVEVGGV